MDTPIVLVSDQDEQYELLQCFKCGGTYYSVNISLDMMERNCPYCRDKAVAEKPKGWLFKIKEKARRLFSSQLTLVSNQSQSQNHLM